MSILTIILKSVSKQNFSIFLILIDSFKNIHKMLLEFSG